MARTRTRCSRSRRSCRQDRDAYYCCWCCASVSVVVVAVAADEVDDASDTAWTDPRVCWSRRRQRTRPLEAAPGDADRLAVAAAVGSVFAAVQRTTSRLPSGTFATRRWPTVVVAEVGSVEVAVVADNSGKS